MLASPHFGLHLPFWAILPIALAVACLFGVLLGRPRSLRGDYLAIVTLGFGEIIRIFPNNLNSPVNITNGPQGINRIDTFKVGEFAFGRTETLMGIRFTGPEKYYYLLLALTLIIVVVCLRLQNSRIGRAGKPSARTRSRPRPWASTPATSSCWPSPWARPSAAWPARCSPRCRASSVPRASLMESISILCMVVLGGMGHIPGVILGAIILAGLPEFLRAVVEPAQHMLFGAVVLDPEGIRMLLFGLAMVCVMLFRPAGLWPSAVRKRELSSKAQGDAA